MTTAHVNGLVVYPVKSMKGVSVDTAKLTAEGLEHDRRFMVVREEDRRFVTQRELPALALIHTRIGNDGVELSRVGAGQAVAPFAPVGDDRVESAVWGDRCEVIDLGDAIADWLTGAVESADPLRLVRMAPGFVRPQGKPELLGDDTHTHFADAAPFLVTSTASLETLNRALDERGHEPVPMDRFRPNVIIEGLDPFAEHSVASLAGGGYQLTFRHPCQRCVVTTIDQDTAARHAGWQPYRTLVEINPVPGKDRAPAFGQNASLASGAGTEIRIGDRLEVSLDR